VDRERREDRLPGDAEIAQDFKLAWGTAEDRWTEAAGDTGEPTAKGKAKPKDDRRDQPGPPLPEAESPASDVPWDELADDTPPQFEAESFAPPVAGEPAQQRDDEAPPHGDPLDQQADVVFERDRPRARMDSLQDALASIRERVQTLSTGMRTAQPGAASGRTSQLALYRAATDDRTYAELRRHSGETEELLRRMSSLMQDLSLDLRSIVDAARRAIDQTSEQAESSIELGRLLGERIEQLDERVAARLDVVGDFLGQRVDQMDSAMGSLQVHLDKRLTKLEQRSGVGMLREEMGELRADVGDVRGDLGTLRDEVGAVGEVGSVDLQERLDAVGTQLDRTLATLRDLVEGAPEQDEAVVDGVVAAIKTETEAAVEPFRLEVEELGRQLGEALDREEQLGETLTALTDEVQRLRKRIAVRTAPPTIDGAQIQSIVDAVVAALPAPPAAAAQPAARAARRRAAPPEPEPEPEPEPPSKRRRERPVRAKRTKKAAPTEEPEDRDAHLDVPDDEFAPLPDASVVAPGLVDEGDEEEAIRRARVRGRKSSQPLVKGRRTRSSQR
jgi:methyl-accepting chemotaxis protein